MFTDGVEKPRLKTGTNIYTIKRSAPKATTNIMIPETLFSPVSLFVVGGVFTIVVISITSSLSHSKQLMGKYYAGILLEMSKSTVQAKVDKSALQ
jgi:hypothetical protein